MNRKVILGLGLAALLICIVALAGCTPGGDDTAFPGDITDDPGEERQTGAEGSREGEAEGVVSPGEEGQNPEGEQPKESSGEVRITLFFSDLRAVEQGETGATGYVKSVARTYLYTQSVLRLALEELIKGPLPGENGLGKVMPDSTRIRSLKIEDKVAFIDFSSELTTAPDAPGGTTGSTIFMQAVVYTATQFSTVDAVMVTVEGEPYGDGHWIWDEPLRRP